MNIEFGEWACSKNRAVRVEVLDDMITFDVSYTPPDEKPTFMYANITPQEAKRLRKMLKKAIRKSTGGGN